MGPERGQGPREAEGAPRAGAWGPAVPLEVEERAWGSGALGAPAPCGLLGRPGQEARQRSEGRLAHGGTVTAALPRPRQEDNRTGHIDFC